jgi:hypothetical protein
MRAARNRSNLAICACRSALGHGAPPAIHSRSQASSFAESFSDSLGGIADQSSEVRLAASSSGLLSGLPRTSDASPLSPPRRAPASVVRSSEPSIFSRSAPWQARHFVESSGSTRRTKSCSAACVLGAALAGAGSSAASGARDAAPRKSPIARPEDRQLIVRPLISRPASDQLPEIASHYSDSSSRAKPVARRGLASNQQSKLGRVGPRSPVH